MRGVKACLEAALVGMLLSGVCSSAYLIWVTVINYDRSTLVCRLGALSRLWYSNMQHWAMYWLCEAMIDMGVFVRRTLQFGLSALWWGVGLWWIASMYGVDNGCSATRGPALVVGLVLMALVVAISANKFLTVYRNFPQTAVRVVFWAGLTTYVTLLFWTILQVLIVPLLISNSSDRLVLSYSMSSLLILDAVFTTVLASIAVRRIRRARQRRRSSSVVPIVPHLAIPPRGSSGLIPRATPGRRSTGTKPRASARVKPHPLNQVRPSLPTMVERVPASTCSDGSLSSRPVHLRVVSVGRRASVPTPLRPTARIDEHG